MCCLSQWKQAFWNLGRNVLWWEGSKMVIYILPVRNSKQSWLLTLKYPIGHQLHVQHTSAYFSSDIRAYIFYSFNLVNSLGPSMELNLRNTNITIYGSSYFQYSSPHSPTTSDTKHIHYFHSLFQSCKGFWVSGWWINIWFFWFSI